MDADQQLVNALMRHAVLRVLRNILVILIALAGTFVLVMLCSGAKGFAVQSDSMAPRLKRGDAVFVRRVAFEDLAVGDVVSASFPTDDGVFTHRIVSIDAENRQIHTRGDHTFSEDPAPTDASHIIGKLWFSVPYAGYLSIALQNNTLIYIALGAAIVLILVRIVLTHRKTKSRGV